MLWFDEEPEEPMELLEVLPLVLWPEPLDDVCAIMDIANSRATAATNIWYFRMSFALLLKFRERKWDAQRKGGFAPVVAGP